VSNSCDPADGSAATGSRLPRERVVDVHLLIGIRTEPVKFYQVDASKYDVLKT
jgi:hypothetical protein